MPGFRSKEYRPLTFVADWKRSIPYVTEFDRMADDDLDEPHLKRKRAILNNHPHVTELYGIEPHTKYLLAVLLAVQLSIAYYVGHNNINSILHAVIVYVVGASLTQIFGTVIHEACHNLTAKSPLANRIIALVANIPIPFPIAASFRRYHLEHHAHQGIYDKDPDLPLPWEIQFAKGNPIFKALFLFFYPLMYVVRGIAMNKAPSNWELINIAWTITTDVILYRFLGHDGFMYLFYSLWFGYGIHPAGIFLKFKF
jgi:sphingolipid delta-4 desaturase